MSRLVASQEDAEPAKVRGCFARVAVLMATFHQHPTLPCNFSEVRCVHIGNQWGAGGPLVPPPPLNPTPL